MTNPQKLDDDEAVFGNRPSADQPTTEPSGQARVEWACEVMHDAYEAAAVREGWETQERSRKPWTDVPDANKATMRAAVGAVLALLAPAPQPAAETEPSRQEVTDALYDVLDQFGPIDLGYEDTRVLAQRLTIAVAALTPAETETETEVQWGVQYQSGNVAEAGHEEHARAIVSAAALSRFPSPVVVRRTVTPWTEAL